MTEKRFTNPITKTDADGTIHTNGILDANEDNKILISNYFYIAQVMNELHNENEQLKSVNQELRNELKFDEIIYKDFKEIIDEADDLITSHLSKHYQRKWKNFCKSKGMDV